MMQKEYSEKLKVIIVDDFKIIVERLMRVLENIPDVSIAGSSHHAETVWNLIESSEPHVVIMDINLRFAEPRHGIAFLRRLKEKCPHIKVIVFTNYVDTGYRELCALHGADFFFDKASESELVIDAIKHIATGDLASRA